MDLLITLPGGKRVDAHFGNFTVATDQPTEAGGSGSAPAPFDLFLASLGTCAGIYVVGFCQARGIDTSNIRIHQHVEHDASGKVTHIELRIETPPDFPDRYRESLIRVASQCKVKKLLADPPVIEVTSPPAGLPTTTAPVHL